MLLDRALAVRGGESRDPESSRVIGRLEHGRGGVPPVSGKGRREGVEKPPSDCSGDLWGRPRSTNGTNLFFQSGAAFAGLVILFLVVLEGKELAQTFGLRAEDEPVLVFEIPHPDRLASVRKAIRDECILEERDVGFSVKSGRVYVLDRGQAGAFIGRGGWIDQAVQIVGVGMDRDEEIEDGAKPVMSREETRARLDDLMKKASLTRGEQLFVLKAMNDGVEI